MIWLFFSVLSVCFTALVAIRMSYNHDYRIQRMELDAKTTFQAFEAYGRELTP